jgi:hypothetical protein
MAASREASSSTSNAKLSYKLTNPESSSSKRFDLSANPQSILEMMCSEDYLRAGATLSLEGDDLPPSVLAVCGQGFVWEMQSTYFASKTDLVFRVLNDTFSGAPRSTLSPKQALGKLKELFDSDKQQYKMLNRIFSDEHTYDVDAIENGQTPLCEVLSSTSFTAEKLAYVIDLLIMAGANIELIQPKGDILFRAASMGHSLIVRQLLFVGADKNTTREDGGTPLYIAAQRGHLTVVEVLLAAGADKNLTLTAGATPLYIAAGQGHQVVVELLLTAGADKNAACTSGATPLYIAAQEGHQAVVELLLAAGADKNITRVFEGDRPIEAARRNNHREIASLIENWVYLPSVLSCSLSSTRPYTTNIKLNQYLHKFSHFDKGAEGVLLLYQKIAQEQRFFQIEKEVLLSFVASLFQSDSITDEVKNHCWIIVAMTLIERMAKDVYSQQSLISTLDFCMKGYLIFSKNEGFLEIFEFIRARLFELLKNITHIGQKTVIFSTSAIADYQLLATMLLNYQDEQSVVLAKIAKDDASIAKVLLNYDGEIDSEVWNTEEGQLALINLAQAIEQERQDFHTKLASEKERLETLIGAHDKQQLANKINAITSLLTTIASQVSAPSSSTDTSIDPSMPLLKVLRNWAKDNPNQYKDLIEPIRVLLLLDTKTKEIFEAPFQSVIGQGYKKAYQTIFNTQQEEIKEVSPNHPNSFFHHRQVFSGPANFESALIPAAEMTYDSAQSATELQFIL